MTNHQGTPPPKRCHLRAASGGRRRRVGALTIAVALTASAPLAAAAEPGSTERAVVIAPPVFAGDLPPARQGELGAALQRGLAQAGLSAAPASAQTPPCAATDCAHALATATGVPYAVTMRVDVQRRDYTIALGLVRADDGETLARTETRCEVCGIAEAADAIVGQSTALRDRLDALNREAPLLSFQSDPDGAIVRLDGVVVGETPFERVVDPGPHRAEAQRDGFVPEARQFEAVPGVAATIRFDLDAVPRTQRDRRLGTFGWVAFGVGAAGVATGVTLIVLDGRPNRTQCSGDNVDPRGNCKFLYGTLGAGIGALVAGTALLATGVGIAIKTRVKRRGKDARARVRPRPGSFAIAF